MIDTIRDGHETGRASSHAGNKVAVPIDQRLDRNEHIRRLRTGGRGLWGTHQVDLELGTAASYLHAQLFASLSKRALRDHHSWRGLRRLVLDGRDQVPQNQPRLRRRGSWINAHNDAVFL